MPTTMTLTYLLHPESCKVFDLERTLHDLQPYRMRVEGDVIVSEAHGDRILACYRHKNLMYAYDVDDPSATSILVFDHVRSSVCPSTLTGHTLERLDVRVGGHAVLLRAGGQDLRFCQPPWESYDCFSDTFDASFPEVEYVSGKATVGSRVVSLSKRPMRGAPGRPGIGRTEWHLLMDDGSCVVFRWGTPNDQGELFLVRPNQAP